MTVEVFGHGLDVTSEVDIQGDGLSAEIVKTENGLTNNSQEQGMIGSIHIRLDTYQDTALGKKTVRLYAPLGVLLDKFVVMVYPRGAISNIVYSTPNGWFKTLELRVNGHDLGSITKASIETQPSANVPAIDKEGRQYQNNNFPYLDREEILATNILRNDSTNEVIVQVIFAHEWQQLPVNVNVRSNQCSSGAAGRGEDSFVLLKSKPYSGPNYVKSIIPQQGCKVGDACKATVTLLRKPKPLLELRGFSPEAARKFREKQETSNPDGLVWWTLYPANTFTVDGCSLNSKCMQRVAPGYDSADLSFRMTSCPTGCAHDCQVNLKTWTYDPDASAPPKYLDKAFTIICPSAR